MKKGLLVLILILALLVTTGCEKVEEGLYEEGTYLGTVLDEDHVTTAVIYVDDSGVLKSVFIDTTYSKDDVNTTKKTLGDDYGMLNSSSNQGVIEGGAEWYEQVEVFENKIVEEQGLDWVTYTDDEETKTDAVSGVTISIDSYYSAVENALSQALK